MLQGGEIREVTETMLLKLKTFRILGGTGSIYGGTRPVGCDTTGICRYWEVSMGLVLGGPGLL